MTAIGWVFMIVSVGCVVSWVVFCYWHVLTAPPPPPDSET